MYVRKKVVKKKMCIFNKVLSDNITVEDISLTCLILATTRGRLISDDDGFVKNKGEGEDDKEGLKVGIVILPSDGDTGCPVGANINRGCPA